MKLLSLPFKYNFRWHCQRFLLKCYDPSEEFWVRHADKLFSLVRWQVMGARGPQIWFKFSCHRNPAETRKQGQKQQLDQSSVQVEVCSAPLCASLVHSYLFFLFSKFLHWVYLLPEVCPHHTHTHTHTNEKGEIIECSPSYVLWPICRVLSETCWLIVFMEFWSQDPHKHFTDRGIQRCSASAGGIHLCLPY